MLRDETVAVDSSWATTTGTPLAGGTMNAAGVAAAAAAGESGKREKCEQLHRRLKRIVKARGSLDLQEAAALREAQALGLWRQYGYNCLSEYMERELGYTPRAAIERLRVANAIVELPQIAAALEQGDLSFSGARELTRVATPETEQAWLGATAEMNVREVEAAVSGHAKGDAPTDPIDPKLVKKILRYEVRPETQALERQVKLLLEKERGERVDDDGLLEALFRYFLDGQAEGGRGRAAYQVAVTVCKACKRGWQHGGGLLAEMTPGGIERAMCDAVEIGDVTTHKVERARQAIPPAMRRKVKHRDNGRCRVPGCRSVRNLDIHHLCPLSHGGTNSLENLITLCEGHHIALHDGTLMLEIVGGEVRIVREGRNSFTRATRAVDTAAALRKRGIDREVVRAAIEKTRAHVGTNDLRLEQWIDIALRYCEADAGGG